MLEKLRHSKFQSGTIYIYTYIFTYECRYMYDIFLIYMKCCILCYNMLLVGVDFANIFRIFQGFEMF